MTVKKTLGWVGTIVAALGLAGCSSMGGDSGKIYSWEEEDCLKLKADAAYFAGSQKDGTMQILLKRKGLLEGETWCESGLGIELGSVKRDTRLLREYISRGHVNIEMYKNK